MTSSAQSADSKALMDLVQQRREQLQMVLSSYGAENPRIFGSVVRGEADADSDIDILFSRPAGMGLFTIARMQRELSAVLGVLVDAVPDAALYEHLRSRVLDEAVPL